jgi:hypothetical protein
MWTTAIMPGRFRHVFGSGSSLIQAARSTAVTEDIPAETIWAGLGIADDEGLASATG